MRKEKKMSKDESKKEDQNQENKIHDMASISVGDKNHKIYCMSIIGEIEGHMVLPPQSKTTKYEHVIPELVRIEEDDSIKGLLLLLNTMGGDVEAGLAIAEVIASMKKPTVSVVLGGGHSIGVPLAVSAKYSLIVPSATMTIHPIRMNGTVIGVPQMFHYFSKVQDRLTDFVTRNSKIKEETFRSLMMETKKIANDVGTILFGEEAVECGLIDEVGGISEAIAQIERMTK
ncbi:MAG: ATP-dependent Clp protease proteolytic subunit [Clostridia bacterium]|nr:ATP-dependent Clp protease proteolytic subunit [Clostridia bacterium]